MGLALTGGPNILGMFAGSTSREFLLGLEHHLRAAGWKREAVAPAFCVGWYGWLPGNGTNVRIESREYHFRQTLDNARPGDVKIGDSREETLVNLAAAINGSAGAGVRYSAATAPHGAVRATAVSANSIRVQYRQAGVGGNGVIAQGNPFESTWTAGEGAPAGRMWNGTSRLRGTSPQGLAVLVDLYDTGRGAKVRFVSAVNPARQGLEHHMNCTLGRTYQVIAGPCQLFVSVPGLRFDVSGSTVAGGALRVTDPGVDNRTYEAWWSSGDAFDSPFFPASNPRICLRLKDLETNSNPWSTAAMWNGQFCAPYSAADHQGCAQILCITATSNVDLTYFLRGVHSQVAFLDGSPIHYDPFVAWGNVNLDAPLLRGQLWDARIGSLPEDMDRRIADPDGRHWINFTDRFPWGALWLLYDPAPPLLELPSNYAY